MSTHDSETVGKVVDLAAALRQSIDRAAAAEFLAKLREHQERAVLAERVTLDAELWRMVLGIAIPALEERVGSKGGAA